MTYSDAKFDGDSDFAIKHDLRPRFDVDMSTRREKVDKKYESSQYYDLDRQYKPSKLIFLQI